jgi:hypothetical protein
MTDRRALTSAANGRRSRGPVTPSGKAISRFNAAKHGILARVLLIRAGEQEESADELRRLHAQLRAELGPEGIVEEMLVEKILVAYWRLRRVLVAEQGLIRRQADNAGMEHGIALVTAHNDRLRLALTPLNDHLLTGHGAKHVAEIMRDCLADLDELGTIGEATFARLKRLFTRDLLGRDLDSDIAGLIAFRGWADSYAAGEPEGDGRERPTREQCVAVLRLTLEDYLHRATVTGEVAGAMERQRGEAAAMASLLPAAADAERLLRYEGALERQLYRAIGELREVQRARLGGPTGGRAVAIQVGKVELRAGMAE